MALWSANSTELLRFILSIGVSLIADKSDLVFTGTCSRSLREFVHLAQVNSGLLAGENAICNPLPTGKREH